MYSDEGLILLHFLFDVIEVGVSPFHPIRLLRP
jgi:hypothetical protein